MNGLEQMMMDAIILMFLALLLISGLYLLISGWRGRRVGDEPRCRKCEYILLHLTSDRCPECGTGISAESTVIGEYQRRWGRAVTGIVLLILACLPMVPPVRKALVAINWYSYKPASWVLRDLDSPGMFDMAAKELAFRDLARKLPESVRQKLIEKALLDQAAAALPSHRTVLQYYLGDTFADGRLTPSQVDRFLDQAIIMTLTVRPIVAEGDQVPYSMNFESRVASNVTVRGGTSSVLWYETTVSLYKVNGEVRPRSGGFSSRSTFSFGGQGTLGSRASASPVGKHTLEVDLVWTFWYGPPHDKVMSRQVDTRTYSGKASYEVVPRELVPAIELLYTSELEEQVRAAIRQPIITRHLGAGHSVMIHMDDAPCNTAFDVFVKNNQEEMRVGSVAFAKGKGTRGYNAGGHEIRQPLPDKVTVILRPSVEAAKNTVDLTAIYSGEIEFADVEVKLR